MVTWLRTVRTRIIRRRASQRKPALYRSYIAPPTGSHQGLGQGRLGKRFACRFEKFFRRSMSMTTIALVLPGGQINPDLLRVEKGFAVQAMSRGDFVTKDKMSPLSPCAFGCLLKPAFIQGAVKRPLSLFDPHEHGKCRRQVWTRTSEVAKSTNGHHHQAVRLWIWAHSFSKIIEGSTRR